MDEHTRECLALWPEVSSPSATVVRVLAEIVEVRGAPQRIMLDNGPEMIANALDTWAYEQGITLTLSRPGEPVDNSCVESFHGRFRGECLNLHWYQPLTDARDVIEGWRIDHNTTRPHSSLGGRTPSEYAAELLNPEEQNEEQNEEHHELESLAPTLD